MKTQIRDRRTLHDQLSRIAASQHGLVTMSQLREVGFRKDEVVRDLKLGRLITVHRGIYSVGYLSGSPHRRAMAAALACGNHCLVSHWTAARMWRLIEGSGEKYPVDVSITSSDRRVPGIEIRRVSPIYPVDRKEVDGVPVTGPARTLLDLAGCAKLGVVKTALNEARKLKLVRDQDILDVMQRYPRRAGAATLRKLLEGQEVRGYTLSKAEERMVELVHRYSLPPVECNVTVEDFLVDFLWREEGLIVEVDGRAFHLNDDSFESDRSRDRELVLADYTVLRVTWTDLTRRPATIARQISEALDMLRQRRLNRLRS